MLKLQDINVTLGKNTKLERQVLQKLNLYVKHGESIIIIGSNGAGKSTMLNVISGSMKPESGKVIFDNKDITDTTQYSRAAYISRVMQDPRVGTMEKMTIFENMAFALKRGQKRGLAPLSNHKRRSLFRDKLAILKMKLEDRLDESVINLSGGQRQALSLIMAIISNYKILLLDEFTAALDPKTAENIMQLTDSIIREEKRTSIMVTHNMAHAIKYGGRLLFLKDGKIVKEYGAAEKQQLTPTMLVLEFGEI